MPVQHRYGFMMVGLLGGIAASTACAETADDGARAQDQDVSADLAARKSPWGYALSPPFAEDTEGAKRKLREAVPLDAIGAVVTSRFPYRATATYLGSPNGQHLFAIAAHVASRGLESVVFGQLDNRAITVRLDPVPVFSSMPNGDAALHSDVSIVRAAPGMDAATASALQHLPVTKWTFRPVKELLAEVARDPDPRAGAYFVGRASMSATAGAIESEPLAWGSAGAAYQRPRALAEAARNLDHNPNGDPPVGDVLVATKFEIQAGGATQALFDPDGLTLDGQSTPFLAADTGWKVVSLAGNYIGVGRTSGSPIFIRTSRGAFVVGIHWTSGVSEDLAAVRPDPRRDPARAFGDVREEPSGDGFRLALHQTAPLAFAATLESAAADLQATIDRTTDPAVKGALVLVQKAATEP